MHGATVKKSINTTSKRPVNRDSIRT